MTTSLIHGIATNKRELQNFLIEYYQNIKPDYDFKKIFGRTKYKLSEETKQLMRRPHKKFDEETRKKISERRKGTKLSEETKQKIREKVKLFWKNKGENK
jgi:hypothetical protein